YTRAYETCKAEVERIVAECSRQEDNRQDAFCDLDFDLEGDRRDCLFSLDQDTGEEPDSKRIKEIFEWPTFFGDEIKAQEITQGELSNCWFLAALATVTRLPWGIKNICVAQNEEFGVYGFVFRRDGEWTSVVVNDQVEKAITLNRNGEPSSQSVRSLGDNSAPHFARSHEPRKTWLSMLEKAFAKLHGDYGALGWGFTGEGVEDLAGGVTSEYSPKKILNPDSFWTNELLKVNDDFLFGCSIDSRLVEEEYKQSNDDGDVMTLTGLASDHAYSVLRAVEKKGKRLVFISDPRRTEEWTGRWSNNSQAWTEEWKRVLDYQPQNDGCFWMEYSDFLKEWTHIERVRLFNKSWWAVASHWVEVSPIRPATWEQLFFLVTLTKDSPAVIVLSQLDTRYFKGLAGPFNFGLDLKVFNERKEWYTFRSSGPRSVNMELDLPAGRYIVCVKIDCVKID
ncbi:hypothetical protein BDK51DRAFT_2675, partial [Blyttiomyces helicus]